MVQIRHEIWIRKSWKSKYYTQTETRRDPECSRFEAKRCNEQRIFYEDFSVFGQIENILMG